MAAVCALHVSRLLLCSPCMGSRCARALVARGSCCRACLLYLLELYMQSIPRLGPDLVHVFHARCICYSFPCLDKTSGMLEVCEASSPPAWPMPTISGPCVCVNMLQRAAPPGEAQAIPNHTCMESQMSPHVDPVCDDVASPLGFLAICCLAETTRVPAPSAQLSSERPCLFAPSASMSLA